MATERAAPGTSCGSCGADVEVMAPVRRVYLEASPEGTLTVSDTTDDVEWWCPGCAVLYPHRPAGDG